MHRQQQPTTQRHEKRKKTERKKNANAHLLIGKKESLCNNFRYFEISWMEILALAYCQRHATHKHKEQKHKYRISGASRR